MQLKLVRPVSVPATKKTPTIHDAKKVARSQAVKRRTSFYLPKDTVKHLHIISRTRASEVIEALLKKFMVVDNPRKFALFERSEKEDQGTGIPLSSPELTVCPSAFYCLYIDHLLKT